MDSAIASKRKSKTNRQMNKLKKMKTSEMTQKSGDEKKEHIHQQLEGYDKRKGATQDFGHNETLEKRFFKSVIAMRCLYEQPLEHILNFQKPEEVFLKYCELSISYNDLKSFITGDTLAKDFIDIYSIYAVKPETIYIMTTEEASYLLKGSDIDLNWLKAFSSIAIPFEKEGCCVIINKLSQTLKFFAYDTKPLYTNIKIEIASKLKIADYYSQLIKIDQHPLSTLSLLSSLLHGREPGEEFSYNLTFKESILKDLIA